MGFGDMELFNLFLLAKQAWRILNYPHLLVYRLLKANISLMSFYANGARRSSNGYVVRDSACTLAALGRFTHQKIGNGLNTPIWEGPHGFDQKGWIAY